jgi:hypothetical protein
MLQETVKEDTTSDKEHAMNHGPFYRSAELVAGVHRAGAGSARAVGGGDGGVTVRGGCGNRGGSRDRGKGERLQRSAQRRRLV